MKKKTYKIIHIETAPVSAKKMKHITNLVGTYCIRKKMNLCQMFGAKVQLYGALP